MKFVIAPDKFKGSLTGIEFCDIVEKGILEIAPHSEIYKLPLADGGDGTVEVLKYYLGGEIIHVTVQNPIGKPTPATYLFSKNKHLAFIEMAEASGIKLLTNEQLNPLETTTFGTGQLLLHAIELGAKHIILGIGGSATNDAGMGTARALGYQFFDVNNHELEGRGKDLSQLYRIDASQKRVELDRVSFEIACDVNNPLFGTEGAAYVYAPQKGADSKIVQELDKGFENFNNVVLRQYGINLQEIKGAGAAGGLGAGSICFLNATLKPGIELIKSIVDFDKIIENADWIITGEGKFDDQTFSGKVIKGIIDSISNQRLAVFCGTSQLSEHQIKQHGIDYIDQMTNYATDINDSIKNSKTYLKMSARKFARLLQGN